MSNSPEPDQIDMMGEDELRTELRKVLIELEETRIQRDNARGLLEAARRIGFAQKGSHP